MELDKWATPEDELCPEYNKYYTEDSDEEANYVEIDLSKYGGNGSNGTFA